MLTVVHAQWHLNATNTHRLQMMSLNRLVCLRNEPQTTRNNNRETAQLTRPAVESVMSVVMLKLSMHCMKAVEQTSSTVLSLSTDYTILPINHTKANGTQEVAAKAEE